MAYFSVDVEKLKGTEYWTNRYIVLADNIGEATGHAEVIYQAERTFHLTNVTFTKYRVSDYDPNNGAYVIVTKGTQGQKAVNAGESLPLFVVVRVDFPVTVGRPSRKYYRGVLSENDLTDGVIAGTTQSTISNALSAVVSGSWFIDVDGQLITQSVIIPDASMRQLRRGTRRRTEPVIPG